MKTFLLPAILGLLLGAAGWASDEGRTLTPDEQGHILKMTREMVTLGVTRDPETRVDQLLRAGEERLKELSQMHQSGKTTRHDALARSYEKHVMLGAASVIEAGAAHGKDMAKACQRYEEATAKHLKVLESLVEKVPPQARKGILHALEASKHGHEQAQLAHERGRGRARLKGNPHDRGRNDENGQVPGVERPAGKPSGVGKPDDKGAPQDRGNPGKHNPHRKSDLDPRDKIEEPNAADDGERTDVPGKADHGAEHGPPSGKGNSGKGGGERGPPSGKGHGKGQ